MFRTRGENACRDNAFRLNCPIADWLEDGRDTPAGLEGMLWVLSELKLSLDADALPVRHLPNAARPIEAVLPEFGQHLAFGIG